MSVVSVFAALPTHGAPLAMPLNDDTVTPGFLGFGVFVALLIALIFLIRSMNKQIRKIQAPREADLKQQEWEAAQAAKAVQVAKDEPSEKP
ncbi:hypothetical protein [Actinomadura sp. NBRC 104412]|uniref:hypothetical protein n=1 Tax=Actinomadura sp. NBRC 104412 TaxID=3032203 RepID=UPI002553F67E|nr:hypothetical protein [Actinomadura sp. NBRC 104412]